MPSSVDQTREFDYILACDRGLPPEEQTVFHLRVPSAREVAQIEGMTLSATAGEGVRITIGTQILRILEFSVVGWKNFRDASGAEIPFDAKAKARCWDYLRPEWREELFCAIAAFLMPEAARACSSYRRFKNGLLPVDGGPPDQATFLAAIQVIKSEVADWRARTKRPPRGDR